MSYNSTHLRTKSINFSSIYEDNQTGLIAIKHSKRSGDAKPSQAKVLTEGGDLREAQVDIPLSVSHSWASAHCWTQTDTFTLTGGRLTQRYGVRLGALTDKTKD